MEQSNVRSRHDLTDILAGLVAVTVQIYLAGGSSSTDHLNGAMTMARSIALASGLQWPSVMSGVADALGPDVPGLLDGTVDHIAERLSWYTSRAHLAYAPSPCR